MSRYELSLSTGYVKSWTVVEAIRELFQNAIDQQTSQPDNEMFFDYTSSNETLVIGNKLSSLDVRTLLLGESSKQDDNRTIGQFGEGYKLALLVLCRLGKRVTIYNYAERETWHPKIVKSRRYNAEILCVDVDSKFIWSSVPDNNLTFEIQGISHSEYLQLCHNNLNLQPADKVKVTSLGTVLLEECFRGKIFVSGLYISSTTARYGYSFKPEYIKLDRDRRLIPEFDLQWTLGALWREADEPELVAAMMRDGCNDVKFFQAFYVDAKPKDAVSQVAYRNFKAEYGPRAVPVTTQADMETMSYKMKPGTNYVIVPPAYQLAIMDAPEMKEYIEENEAPAEEKTPIEELESFLISIRSRLTTSEWAQANDIVGKLKDWGEG